MADRITTTTENVFIEVEDRRRAAHAKHGENSIEAVKADDLRWLSILVEEVGEAAHELTYDAHRVDVHSGEPLPPDEQKARARAALRGELMDVITVATAWVAAIDEAD